MHGRSACTLQQVVNAGYNEQFVTMFLQMQQALVGVDHLLDRTDLSVIYDHERKSNAGRRPFDVVLMFKILILQSLYNLSDDEMEYQIMTKTTRTSGAVLRIQWRAHLILRRDFLQLTCRMGRSSASVRTLHVPTAVSA